MRFELVWAFSSDGASVQILYHVVMYERRYEHIYTWQRICTDAPSELKAHTSSNRMDKYLHIMQGLLFNHHLVALDCLIVVYH